jgi:hypothetical protein
LRLRRLPDPNGVATFIDGFRLLDDNKTEATLMPLGVRRPSGSITSMAGRKIYSGDIATVHLGKLSAVHTREPAVDAKSKN